MTLIIILLKVTGSISLAVACLMAGILLIRARAERGLFSWITTTLGFAAMLLGAWAFYVRWIPYQTAWFNLVYVEIPQITLFLCGWIGLHAADHRAVKKHFEKHNLK